MRHLVILSLLAALCWGCGDNADGLQGQWVLERFVDKENDSVCLPGEQEDPISITFKDDGRFEGHTGRNTYGGNYSTNIPAELALANFFTSHVGESDWGNKYYDALAEGYHQEDQAQVFPYHIQQGELTLNYAANKEMVFRRH